MQNLIDIVTNEYLKYDNNIELLCELEKLVNEIPAKLDSMRKKDKIPSSDILKLGTDFLNNPKNQYFYIKSTESFVKYNGEKYVRINEDEIWQAVYTYLRGYDLNTKHTVKQLIIHYIQNKSIFKSIPESKTIQNVINFLYPTILNSKEEAKYFLSIIGDNILKKNKNIIHYFSLDSKSFIGALNDYIYDYISRVCNSSVKWRCYRHNFELCRILKFNKAVLSPYCWNTFLKNNALDILIVSLHYSDRYEGSENFIHNHFIELNTKNYILYLQNKSTSDIVKIFADNCLNIADQHDQPDQSSDSHQNSTKICIKTSWNIIYFVWKQYLLDNNYPNFFFIDSLKQELTAINNLQYDNKLDIFLNVTSPFIKKIKKFQQFWEKTIVEDKQPFCEYEIGEICNLYKFWLKEPNSSQLINQDLMKDMIEYFFSIKLRDNKYIPNIKCSLWCKWLNIDKWINNYKTSYDKNTQNVVISDLYKLYCKFNIMDGLQNNSVSKNYFTKYLISKIPEKYINNNLISHSYFNI